VGDIKSSASPCTDEALTKIQALFETFHHPLVYTPGDNEWTDCHRHRAGKYDPLERLAKVREIFFARQESFGRTTMPLEHQSSASQFAKFVENTRWSRAEVVFATVHVVGSNNNLQRGAAAVQEYRARNAANVAWIRDTFAHATARAAKGVVVFMHADLAFDTDDQQARRSGFTDTLKVLKEQSLAFGKPILIVHGDTHEFIVDKPLLGANKLPIENVTRLIVFGNPYVHGVLVTVDTNARELFSIKPLLIQDN
jgi:hypothetical protein